MVLVVAILALVVSAATPDRRLTELENVVRSILNGMSHHEKRLTENELKMSLLSSKLLNYVEKFDQIDKNYVE